MGERIGTWIAEPEKVEDNTEADVESKAVDVENKRLQPVNKSLVG